MLLFNLGQTEKTLRDQEELIKKLKERVHVLEKLNQDYSQYKMATEQGIYILLL